MLSQIPNNVMSIDHVLWKLPVLLERFQTALSLTLPYVFYAKIRNGEYDNIRTNVLIVMHRYKFPCLYHRKSFSYHSLALALEPFSLSGSSVMLALDNLPPSIVRHCPYLDVLYTFAFRLIWIVSLSSALSVQDYSLPHSCAPCIVHNVTGYLFRLRKSDGQNLQNISMDVVA